MTFDRFSNNIGLALGGGGARGVAHIGVLKALSESKLKIGCISGTSVGAFIATLYAFGLSWSEIQDIFSKMSLSKIGNFTFKLGYPGLMDGSPIAETVRKYIGDVDISESKIPLALVCCDLISGKNVVLTEGPAPLLVQASGAFPGLFHPVEYNGMLLVDGFLTENVPVSAIKKLKSNFIVAVKVGAKEFDSSESLGIKNVLNRSFDILVDKPLEHSLDYRSYLIDLDLSHIDRFKVSHINESIDLGYNQTQVMLNKSILYWYFRPIRKLFFELSQSWLRFLSSILNLPKLKSKFRSN